MSGLVGLIAACCLLIGFALWADATGFDPWTWLYGSTDPRELVARAHEPQYVAHHPRCAVELGFNACTCAAFGGAA